MAAAEKSICICSDLSGLERVRYFPRQLLKADDMRAEQDYFREKLRRHNRFMHGTGVVCGLEVMPDASAGKLGVKVCPGYALDPWGEEIHVPEAASLDLALCARGSGESCQPQPVVQPASTEKRPMLVQIRFAECPSRPIRTLPAGCGCDDSGCEYSRIRDSFEIRCVLKPTATKTANAAESDLPACMKCPQEPWLLLAEITLDVNGVPGIDNSVRTALPGAAIPGTT
jgi:hypothetical protein